MARDVAAYDRIAGRMADLYEQAGETGQVSREEAGDPNLIRDPRNLRWSIDTRWVTFECGCVGERAWPLRTERVAGDVVIFVGLPEQAVYDQVCDFHAAGMNVMVGFGGYKTFDQWKRKRKHLLMGTTA